MFISKKYIDISVSGTMTIAQKAIEMKSLGMDVIDLSVGEPDFPTPINIKEAAKNAIDSNKTKYTVNAGLKELREAVSSRLKIDFGLNYGINEIIITSGAKHAIYNSIQSILDPGDEVIIPVPYWVSYPYMVKMSGGVPVFIQTDQDTEFKITAQKLENAIGNKTKAIILCNPSNPTGTVYSKKDLETLGEVLKNKKICVISDEIYSRLIYDNKIFYSIAQTSKELFQKTLLIGGVSKSYAMTGWRIGFAAGPASIIDTMNIIQSHSTSNASTISQHAALEAFTGSGEALRNMRIEFQNRRDYLFEELKSIKGIKLIKPAGSFYLFPNISGLLSRTDNDNLPKNSFELSMMLLNKGLVATVPGSYFGQDGFLRISYATSLDNLKEGVKRIRRGCRLG